GASLTAPRQCAQFSPSPNVHFPPTIGSLIRSFARHPALLAQPIDGGSTGRKLMALRQFGTAAAVAVTLAFAASPAHAVIEIQWWHAMTGANNDVVNRLAEEFNASQSDYKVVPSYK